MIRHAHHSMALLTRLEKTATFWILLGISLVFFLLRLPSLFEPDWYGDEGIYQAIGLAMRHGSLLYAGIWDNKPPLLYVVYAMFASDLFSVRLVSLLLGLASVVLVFSLGRMLYHASRPALIAAGLFAVLYGLPLIEGNIANAENFILFFVLLAGFLLYRFIDARGIRKNLSIPAWSITFPHSGLLFGIGLVIGIAFLFKIVALFDFAAFLVFLYMLHMEGHKLNQLPFSFLHEAKMLILGFITPFLLSVLYFFLHGALGAYIKGAFFSNVGYVNYGNTFVIPQGLLIIKLFLLFAVLSVIFVKRKQLSSGVLFILIWFSFSLFNAHFSQRPYTHYLMVMLPSYTLFVGLLFTKTKKWMFYTGLLLITTGILFHNFTFFPVKKTVLYYGNFFQFVTKQKSVSDYQSFFDRRTPQYYDVAMYIKSHTNPNDPLFIWGNVAQIYALSDTLPVGKYTVAYHIAGKDAIMETTKAIAEKKPRYLVLFDDQGKPPFPMTQYAYKLTIENAQIYEQIH